MCKHVWTICGLLVMLGPKTSLKIFKIACYSYSDLNIIQNNQNL